MKPKMNRRLVIIFKKTYKIYKPETETAITMAQKIMNFIFQIFFVVVFDSIENKEHIVVDYAIRLNDDLFIYRSMDHY